MPRPKARKRTSLSKAAKAVDAPRNDAGLLDLALSMEEAMEEEIVDSPNPADLVLIDADDEDPDQIDPDHVFGFETRSLTEDAAEAQAPERRDDAGSSKLGGLPAAASAEDSDASASGAPAPASSPAPAAATPAPAPAFAPPPPLVSPADVAGGLVAEMQNRFAELQAWADSTTHELNARRIELAEQEAALATRREEIAAQEQKTNHDRERFARYRAAELETLAELRAAAERDAAATLEQAEVDARILRDTAATEGADRAETLQRDAREAMEREHEQARAEQATRRAEFEAALARDQEALDARTASLERDRHRMDKTSEELATLREELDGEWQSVLRLQRSAEMLAKAWEAEGQRRESTSGLRLGSGDASLLSDIDACLGEADDDGESNAAGHVRLAA